MKLTLPEIVLCLCRCRRNTPVLIILSLIIAPWNCKAEVLTLPQGIRIATEQNRLLKIAERQESISEADTLRARSAMYPAIDASLSQTFLAHQPTVIIGTQLGPQVAPTYQKDYLSYSISIQQILYDFKRNASLYGASKAILQTKRLDTARVRNVVTLDVALAYFDVLESDKTVMVAEREVERLTSHLRDANDLYREGVITKNDLLQADVRLSDARQRLLTSKNLRSLGISRLNNILARPPTEETELRDITETVSDYLDLSIEKAWKSAIDNRPEIGIVNETLRSLNLEESARRSGYFPSFFARGAYDYQENRYQLHEGNWTLLLGMTFNIYMGGATKAEVLKVEYQKLQLLDQKAKIEDDIRLEVEKNILDLKNAKERIKVTEGSIAQAEENLRINRIRYSEGVGTATEVLDAVTLFTVAQTNYYKSLYDFRRAEAAFFYSIGKDLAEVYK
jgi:outer membrane protein